MRCIFAEKLESNIFSDSAIILRDNVDNRNLKHSTNL